MTKITITDNFLASDRAVAYGDGFFTTAKVLNGTVELWHLHCARLVECANRLGFPELDFETINQAVNERIFGIELGVLKLLITRGTGGRGYAIPDSQSPSLAILVSEFPAHYQTLPKSGLELDLINSKLAQQPLLAGLKTLNRLEQVLIKQEMQQRNIAEALVCDTEDTVIETSIANLLFVKNDQLFTPSLSKAGIKGVYLTSLQSQFNIDELTIKPNQLESFDAVYCCNSLMGVVPIKRIDRFQFDLRYAHDLMTKLALS